MKFGPPFIRAPEEGSNSADLGKFKFVWPFEFAAYIFVGYMKPPMPVHFEADVFVEVNLFV